MDTPHAPNQRLADQGYGEEYSAWAGIPCRKRYIDDKVTEALGAGIDVVVNLGAGLDTRAYRIPAVEKVAVFELDLPEIIDRKRVILRNLYGRVPAHVTLVPIDFDRLPILSLRERTDSMEQDQPT